MKTLIAMGTFFVVVVGIWLSPAARSEPVRDGNELALAWSTTNAAGKQATQKQTAGIFYTFRFLRVTAVNKDQPAAGTVTVMTIEPSSDMKVALVVSKQLSLELAATLTTNDCVSAYGRIKSMGQVAPDTMVIDPALLKHKDRAGPKLTKEILSEVDPAAY